MKTMKKSFYGQPGVCLGVVALAAALLTGCASTLRLEGVKAGEFKLTGVSKIAFVPFNSLPGDTKVDRMAADAETVALVEKQVASAFARSKLYQVANIENERTLVETYHVRPDHSFDALVYGRVWWQAMPEVAADYPAVVTLDRHDDIPYKGKNLFGQPATLTATVLTRRTDCIARFPYRLQNATLMLSLTFYRVDAKGRLTKIAETFAAANTGFVMDNAELAIKGNDPKAGAPSAQDIARGLYVPLRTTETLPTTLQEKAVLAERLAERIAAKLMPTTTVSKVPYNNGVYEDLLSAQAYETVKALALERICRAVGSQRAAEIAPVAEYDLPEGIAAKGQPLTEQQAALAVLDDLYSLALAEEGSGRHEQALETYRYLYALDLGFRFWGQVDQADFASGIARCLKALNTQFKVDEARFESLSAKRRTRRR